MVAAQFDEALVDGMGDDVMVVGVRLEGAVTKCLDLQCAGHTAQFEIPQVQLAVCKAGRPACSVQGLAPLSRRARFRPERRPWVDATTSAATSANGWPLPTAERRIIAYASDGLIRLRSIKFPWA